MAVFYAVVDHSDRIEELPDSIEVFDDWQTARERFIELVSEDLTEVYAGESEEEIAARAAEYVTIDGPCYEVGDGYIALLTAGVSVELKQSPVGSGQIRPNPADPTVPLRYQSLSQQREHNLGKDAWIHGST